MDGAPGNDRLAAFAQRRESLNEAIEKSGKAIDTWFEQQPFPPSMVALANLEVLIKTRRDVVTELLTLDDEAMLDLLRYRGTTPELAGGSQATTSENVLGDPPA